LFICKQLFVDYSLGIDTAQDVLPDSEVEKALKLGFRRHPRDFVVCQASHFGFRNIKLVEGSLLMSFLEAEHLMRAVEFPLLIFTLAAHTPEHRTFRSLLESYSLSEITPHLVQDTFNLDDRLLVP